MKWQLTLPDKAYPARTAFSHLTEVTQPAPGPDRDGYGSLPSSKLHIFLIAFEEVYKAGWAWWCITVYSGMVASRLA